MPEATIINATKTEQNASGNVSITSFRPIFENYFDEPVLNWSIFLSNDIDSEDNISITFTRIPKYLKNNIYRGMPISFKFWDLGIVDMIVKEINYNLNASISYTTLLLATKKIYLDTYIPGGFFTEDESPKADKAIEKITGKIGSQFNLDIDKDIGWFKSIIINGRQSVYNYIDEALNPGRVKRYNWWIDIFNTLHVQKRTGFSGKKIRIDFNRLKKIMSNVNIRLFFSYDEFESDVSYDLNIPDREKIDQYLHTGGSDTAKTTSELKENKSRESSGSKDAENPPGSLQKRIVKDQYIALTFNGIFWLEPHNVCTLVNFPINITDDCIIDNVSIKDDGINITTEIVFARISTVMPDIKNKDVKAGSGQTEFIRTGGTDEGPITAEERVAK